MPRIVDVWAKNKLNQDMKEKQSLFSDFSTTSKAEWEEKVLKELKGKPFDELVWQIGEQINLSPMYSPEEMQGKSPSLVLDRDTNDWEVGEDFICFDAKESNQELLEALTNGVNAPCFLLEDGAKDLDLKILFQEVKAPYISTHFRVSENQESLLKAFYQLQKDKNEDTAILKGSVNGSLLRAPEAGLGLLRFAIAQLPQFQVFTIDGQDLAGEPAQVPLEIATLLARASETFYVASQAGLEAALVAPRIQFSLSIGTSYFVELAKIRALQLLWPLLLKAYQVDEKIKPQIAARLAATTQIADQELNMIRASSQAMSAVLGGAGRVTILPANAFEEKSNAFTRRIARNVQHILKMESYFDRVIDPAAGSYYLETLTNQLAEQAWKLFQEIEAKKK